MMSALKTLALIGVTHAVPALGLGVLLWANVAPHDRMTAVVAVVASVLINGCGAWLILRDQRRRLEQSWSQRTDQTRRSLQDIAHGLNSISARLQEIKRFRNRVTIWEKSCHSRN
jgi:ABC-type nickel/cobalt efflux system permease component RcnA